MTLIPINDNIRCLIPCDKSKVASGQCGCVNSINDSIYDYLKLLKKQDETPLYDSLPPIKDIDFKSLRKNNILTLRQVETSTGISNAYLSQLENRKIENPSYEVVRKLFKLYKF